MPTLDEMMIDYEAEMIRDADARDARRATPGTVEYAMDRRAAARREREAALMARVAMLEAVVVVALDALEHGNTPLYKISNVVNQITQAL